MWTGLSEYATSRDRSATTGRTGEHPGAQRVPAGHLHAGAQAGPVPATLGVGERVSVSVPTYTDCMFSAPTQRATQVDGILPGTASSDSAGRAVSR